MAVAVYYRERRFHGSVWKEVEEVPVQDTEERHLKFLERSGQQRN